MLHNRKRADAGYLELMISLIISLALGLALITGSKGVMLGTEGSNLTHQLHNELTTQVVNAPFQRGYDTDNLVKIYFDYNSINLYVTQKRQISYALKGPECCNKTVTWESLNSNIASVDSNGIVTGVSPGDTIVYATTSTRVRAKCSVHVYPQVKITINPSSFDLYIGNTRKISYTTDPANPIDSSVKWKSSNSNIATVDSTGNVKGISEGTVTITGTTCTGNTAMCVVYVKQHTCRLTLIATNGGRVSGSGTYAIGSYVYIDASSNNGYEFSHWSDGDTSSWRKIYLTSDVTLYAYFSVSNEATIKFYGNDEGRVWFPYWPGDDVQKDGRVVFDIEGMPVLHKHESSYQKGTETATIDFSAPMNIQTLNLYTFFVGNGSGKYQSKGVYFRIYADNKEIYGTKISRDSEKDVLTINLNNQKISSLKFELTGKIHYDSGVCVSFNSLNINGQTIKLTEKYWGD